MNFDSKRSITLKPRYEDPIQVIRTSLQIPFLYYEGDRWYVDLDLYRCWKQCIKVDRQISDLIVKYLENK